MNDCKVLYSIWNPFPLRSWSEWNLRNVTLVICISNLLFVFVLTLSAVGYGCSGWDRGSQCHIVCAGGVNNLKSHLWSLDNQDHTGHTTSMCMCQQDPCSENSAQSQCQLAVRWCRCTLHYKGNLLGKMVRWGCHLGFWKCLHMHQSCSSSGSHLMVHIQVWIPGHSQTNLK